MEKLRQNLIRNERSGLPVWVPRYARGCTPDAIVARSMIAGSVTVGERTSQDVVIFNRKENFRYRRTARRAARDLATYAEEALGTEKFSIVAFGSMARGLVRQPDSSDPSDIDMDLIVDGDLPEIERYRVRNLMSRKGDEVGIKIDTYARTLDAVKRQNGFEARIYLEGSGYPLIDKGGVWQQVRTIGVENKRFLSLDRTSKKSLRDILALMATGNMESAEERLALVKRNSEAVYEFLADRKWGWGNGIVEQAQYLNNLINS
jgi:hypothetical protein